MNLIVTASRMADHPSYSFRRSHAINFFSRHRVRSLAVTRFPYCQGYPVSAHRQRLCIGKAPIGSMSNSYIRIHSSYHAQPSTTKRVRGKRFGGRWLRGRGTWGGPLPYIIIITNFVIIVNRFFYLSIMNSQQSARSSSG